MSSLATLYMRRTAVYRLFTADGELLYVGASNDPKVRVPQHKAKPWWPEVAATTVEWHPDRLTALHHEASAIGSESPRYNTYRPAPGRWNVAKAASEQSSNGLRLTFEQAARAVDVHIDWLRQGVARSDLPHSCDGPGGDRVWFDPDNIRDLHVIYDPQKQRTPQRADVLRGARLKHCTHAA